MIEIPFIEYVNTSTQGFVTIEDTKNSAIIKFIPKNEIENSKLVLFSHFLFTHRLPKSLLTNIKEKSFISIDLNEYSIIEPDTKNYIFSFISEKGEKKSIKFGNPFYMETFFTQISFHHSIELINETQYQIVAPLHTYRSTSKSNLRNTLSGCVHDLYAHQSLLEFLGFPMDPTKKEAQLKPFEEDWILTLLENPTNRETLHNLSLSLTPIEYCPLLLLILLLDEPLFDGEVNTLMQSEASPTHRPRRVSMTGSPSAKLCERIELTQPKIIKSKFPPIYAIDKVSIGGSTDISSDYAALKLQWSTITESQFLHMNSFRISLKLLENALLATYPSGHPLITAIFDVLASLFVMKDEFSTYISELYYIMTAVAELFHSSDQSLDFGFEQAEHLVFWIFFALITKTETVEFIQNRTTEALMKSTLQILIRIHPLLYTLMEKAGIASFRFPANVIFSLFTKVLPPKKLYPIWIAALSSNDPMDFFQHVMAASLIVIFPNIVDAENVVDQTEKELKKFFEENPAELIVSNTLKLLEATHRY